MQSSVTGKRWHGKWRTLQRQTARRQRINRQRRYLGACGLLATGGDNFTRPTAMVSECWRWAQASDAIRQSQPTSFAGWRSLTALPPYRCANAMLSASVNITPRRQAAPRTATAPSTSLLRWTMLKLHRAAGFNAVCASGDTTSQSPR